MRRLALPLLSTAIKVGTIALRYAKGFGKFSSGETTFVSRFPPAYRPYVKDALQGFQTVGYGGLIAEGLNAYMGLTDTGIDGVQTSQPRDNNQQRKTRLGRGRRTSSRHHFNKCVRDCRSRKKRSF